MGVETVFTIDDADHWRSYLPATSSAFGSLEYARITQTYTQNIARLFVVDSGGAGIAYPFFLRSINSLPFATALTEPLWDIFTPEFTGPIPLVPPSGPPSGALVPPGAGHGFAHRFRKYCREHRIVAEFGHLHPWRAHLAALDPHGVEFNREIVYVDVTRSEQDIWQHALTAPCRRAINRARRDDVQVRRAETPADVLEVYRVYTKTMDRHGADARYYFPDSYFVSFFEQMPENAFFLLSEYNGHVVAGGLYLHDDEDVYYVFGGTDLLFQHVRPMNAQIYQAILWSHKVGKKRLVLGGGYKAQDGVFRFKASFSPLRAEFDVYRRVHLPDAYRSLLHARAAYDGDASSMIGFFPAYRAGIAAGLGT